MNIEAQTRSGAAAPLSGQINPESTPKTGLAKKIQLSAVPSVFPPYPGRTEFDIYASLHRAKDVSGDFYDFYLPKQNTLVFLNADVAGEGDTAVLFMITAKTMLQSHVESGMSIDEAFAAMNKLLCGESFADLLVSAWMGMLDLGTGMLRYVSAGLNPPLLRRKNGSFEYMNTRPDSVFAGDDDAKYHKEELALLPGDEIYLYTDGVTGAENASGQPYGDKRLQDALNASNIKEACGLCAYIKDDVDRFTSGAPQSDDMAMLCMRLNNLQTRDCIMMYPELASVSAIQDFLTRKISEWQISKKYENKVRIAIDEIYSNILRYSGATETKILCRRGDALTLTFMDNGQPYDPTGPEEPDEFAALGGRSGGLGIDMVKSSTRSMEYSYEGGYNTLALTFDLNDRRGV